MIIRKATLEDMPYLYELVVELAVFEKEPDAVTASLEDYTKQFKNNLFEALVAEDPKEGIVGMALYYDTFSTWKGKMLYLEDFVVKESHRSKGIGSIIFDALFEEAKTRGCVLVKWQVLDWNDGAVRFYESKNASIEKNWWTVRKFL